MHPVIGIFAGLLVGEVAHKVATQLDSSDQELKEILDKDDVSEEDLKRAIEIASDDPTKIERVVRGLRQAISMQEDEMDQETINRAYKSLDKLEENGRLEGLNS